MSTGAAFPLRRFGVYVASTCDFFTIFLAVLKPIATERPIDVFSYIVTATFRAYWVSSSHHSVFNASIGSSLAALWAGIKLEITAMIIRIVIRTIAWIGLYCSR